MKVTIYTKANCPNCVAAKKLAHVKGLEVQEVDIEVGERRANFMAAYPEARQMPQIFIGDQRVGGLAGFQAALCRYWRAKHEGPATQACAPQADADQKQIDMVGEPSSLRLHSNDWRSAMASSDGGKGSDRRPGNGYQDNWDKIFGRQPRPAHHVMATAIRGVIALLVWHLHRTAPQVRCRVRSSEMHCNAPPAGVRCISTTGSVEWGAPHSLRYIGVGCGALFGKE